MFTPFKRLFAPPSQSLMSQIFRYSKFLGKSKGKVVSDCKTFAHKRCTIAAKKVCSSANFTFLAVFFSIGATIGIGREMLCLPYVGFFYTILFDLYELYIHVPLWHSGVIELEKKIQYFPLDWRATIHWNVVPSIFQPNHICQGCWKKNWTNITMFCCSPIQGMRSWFLLKAGDIFVP